MMVLICAKCKGEAKNNEEVDAWPWIRYESLERQLEADLCLGCGAKLLQWLGEAEHPTQEKPEEGGDVK